MGLGDLVSTSKLNGLTLEEVDPFNDAGACSAGSRGLFAFANPLSRAGVLLFSRRIDSCS